MSYIPRRLPPLPPLPPPPKGGRANESQELQVHALVGGRRRKSIRRSMRGGSGGATGYMGGLVGTTGQQLALANTNHMGLMSLSGQNITGPGPMNASANYSLINGGQSGGRRKRRCKSRRKSRKQRGGMWGQMLASAAVPLTLLGLQQTFKRRKHRHH